MFEGNKQSTKCDDKSEESKHRNPLSNQLWQNLLAWEIAPHSLCNKGTWLSKTADYNVV